MRNTFINTLCSLAENDERIHLIIADLGFSVVEDFEKRFPDRFLNVGIAEANAISIAAGLALSGKIPYVYSIAPFLTMRAFEQVRLDCAYMNTPARLVGVGGGISYGPAGAPHHAIEDLAVMRALPNMTVIAPGDPWEAENAVKASVSIPGPAYIRLAKNREPIISDTSSNFALGKANVYCCGKDALLLTTSNTFESGAKIVEILQQKGLSVELANMHSLKPFDQDYVLDKIAGNIPVFTFEEHNIIGGLGSIVAEIIAEADSNPLFKRFGIPDEYSHYVGSQKYIREKWAIDEESIACKILELIQGQK